MGSPNNRITHQLSIEGLLRHIKIGEVWSSQDFCSLRECRKSLDRRMLKRYVFVSAPDDS